MVIANGDVCRRVGQLTNTESELTHFLHASFRLRGNGHYSFTTNIRGSGNVLTVTLLRERTT